MSEQSQTLELIYRSHVSGSNFIDRVTGHIRLMRPFAWLWFDVTPCLALALLLVGDSLSWSNVLLAAVLLTLIDSAATTLNDIIDIETDSISSEASRYQRPLVTGLISRQAAWWQWALLNCAALSLSFVFGSGWLLAATLLGVCVGTLYSLPPFRLSSHPRLSQPFWFLCGTTFYLIVAAAVGVLYSQLSLLWLLGYFGFYAVGENLAKDIRDIDNDRDAGKTTVVTRLGFKRAARWSLVGCIFGVSVYTFMVLLTPYPMWLQGTAIMLLLGWLIYSRTLVRRIIDDYSKKDARSLHLGFIRTYLALHLLLIVGGLLVYV